MKVGLRCVAIALVETEAYATLNLAATGHSLQAVARRHLILCSWAFFAFSLPLLYRFLDASIGVQP
jgi:hypothetical protein